MGSRELFFFEKKVDPLKSFSAEEKKIIKTNFDRLSLIPRHIGNDFRMKVELNEPGAGWHWDFDKNVVRVDPKDLLEKPIEYLKFVMAHEGAHRRISRVEGVIPKEVWNQRSFPFLMNAIEDPRINNFVASIDPVAKENMKFAYKMDLNFEEEQKERAQEKLGFQPKFMQAGFEYIKQWFRDLMGEGFKISEDLPEDVRSVVEKTLQDAKKAWLLYPSREQANSGEEKIKAYATASYKIIHEKVWPFFKELVEQDKNNAQLQELLDELREEIAQQHSESQEGGQDKENNDISQELKEHLSEEELKELEDALREGFSGKEASINSDDVEKADDTLEQNDLSKESDGTEEQKGSSNLAEGLEEIDSKEAMDIRKELQEGESERKDSIKTEAIDLDSLSESLREKLKEFIDQLSEDEKEKLRKKAEKRLHEFENELNEEIENKVKKGIEEIDSKRDEFGEEHRDLKPIDTHNLHKQIHEVFEKDKTIYDKYHREVFPLIHQLTNELRNVFRERRRNKKTSGFRYGKEINISRRIHEIARNIPAYETKSFTRKEAPSEKDYAVSLLVDLSGSMEGPKIEETFKATIVLAEVLNNLNIKFEILGFNDKLHEFKKFRDNFDSDVRAKMGSMLEEVESDAARWNDDGWALQETSKRLEREEVSQQFLIVLSDGAPVESPQHASPEYELHHSVDIVQRKGQKLIGIGLLSDAVSRYYKTHISNVGLEEMTKEIAQLIKSIIENPQNY